MSEKNISIVDKLDNISDKMECIISAISYLDIEVCSFNNDDIAGFNIILRDLQDGIKEVKELLVK